MTLRVCVKTRVLTTLSNIVLEVSGNFIRRYKYKNRDRDVTIYHTNGRNIRFFVFDPISKVSTVSKMEKLNRTPESFGSCLKKHIFPSLYNISKIVFFFLWKKGGGAFTKLTNTFFFFGDYPKYSVCTLRIRLRSSNDFPIWNTFLYFIFITKCTTGGFIFIYHPYKVRAI